MPGLFIAFEGPEGAGKSTQVKRQASRLRAAGVAVVVTREPGGTAIGEQIRPILLEPNGHAMLPETEALLFAAARAQLVGEVIRPALEEGAIVLCDRFLDSSLAYQAGGHGLPMSEVRALQGFAIRGVPPDLKVLLDLPVADGLDRRLGGRDAVNRLDLESMAFHERVRATYHTLVAEQPGEWVVIDASRSADLVEASVTAAIGELTSAVGASRR